MTLLGGLADTAFAPAAANTSVSRKVTTLLLAVGVIGAIPALLAVELG